MLIAEIIERLEHLMYGHNYMVTLGTDVFEGVTPEHFNQNLIKKYPDAKPQERTLVETTASDICSEIQAGFDYRGDYGSGLNLTAGKEIELKELQQKYFDFIMPILDDGWKFYSYPEDNGVPGYPVFWNYSFVVFSSNHRILFVYGSSSD